MLIDKKKLALVAAFSSLVVLCFILIIVLVIPRNSDDKDKNGEEICMLRECLLIMEENKKAQTVTTSVCVPKKCISIVDYLEYGQLCILKKCLTDDKEKKKQYADEMTCMPKTCLTSTLKVEKLESVDFCLTSECVSTASEILKLMDHKVDPCEDFYQFACGGFLKKNLATKEMSKTSSEKIADAKISLQIREILESQPSNKDSDALKKAKMVYSSCLDNSRTLEKSVEELKELFTAKKIGMWPSLELKWTDCRADLETRMAVLNAHGVDSFVKLIPEFKGINNTLSGSMYLAEPLVPNICDGTFEDEDGNFTDFAVDVTRNYRDLILRVLDLLNAHENFTEEDTDDLLKFDYKFCNTTKSSRNYFETYHTSSLTLQKLVSVSPQINWSRWHNTFFKSLGLTQSLEKTRIFVYNFQPSIESLAELLESTSSRVLANYLSWRFVLHHLGFLSTSFSQVAADHRSISGKEIKFFMDVQSLSPKWKQCVKYVRTIMPMALIPSYRSKVVSSGLQLEIAEIESIIRKTYNETIKDTKRLMTDERNKCIEKVTNVKFRLLYPDANQTFYDDYYSQLKMLDTSSFLEYGLALRKFQLHNLFSGVQNKVNISHTEYLITLKDPFLASTLSDFRSNRTLLSFGEVVTTGIDFKRPRYLNFGSFGTAVAADVARGFDLKNVKPDMMTPVPPRNWTSWPYYVTVFAERRDLCFEKYFLSNRGKDTSNISMHTIVDNMMADSQGLSISFQAYKAYVKENGKEKHLPGREYSNEQLFFVRYAQTFCNSQPAGKSTNSLRINGAVSNTGVFSEAFLCPEGKNMNPHNKCRNLGT